MTIERHEILGSKVGGNGYGQGKYKGVPVSCKGLARIADVRDATDVGGKNGHTHHPARNRMPRRGELVGAGAFLEERTAEDDNTQREGNEDYEINQMHSLPFLMGRASRA